jgi:hypothetical protein
VNPRLPEKRARRGVTSALAAGQASLAAPLEIYSR